MKIPFNYLPYQFKENKIYFKEWKKLIRSCEFTLGPYVEKFEHEFLGNLYNWSGFANFGILYSQIHRFIFLNYMI